MQSRFNQQKEESRQWAGGFNSATRSVFNLTVYSLLITSIIRLKAEKFVKIGNFGYILLRSLPHLNLCLFSQTVQVPA